MKIAHFSIDDVGLSFRYIYNNTPKTIFDMRLYSSLLKWREKYNLIVNMYCILLLDDFCISSIPDRYGMEFEKNKDWIKYGFHSGNERPFLEDESYRNSYEKAQSFFARMRMGVTDTLRLHSWNASDSQELFLKSKGVKCILMPKDDGYSYNNKGVYFKNGILHRRTDLWFEKVNKLEEKSIKLENDYFAMFTHEWCFDDQKDKIEYMIKLLVDNGYCFV